MHAFKFSRGAVQARLGLDRAAEEVSENEGMAEHLAKARDPAAWESDRIRRLGGAWDFFAADAVGPPFPGEHFPWSA
ncbi:hypothetical protein ABI_45820 [Asticcacaulis biprosthecium C19]|uniref:Uncharacterized protein n=1 Tax=Asticcacaulis biprosthecium C19 TaxID=715226 RepID=F4QTT5_9CAUL|nr:hypothetical protein ABI_45820 [Asticcacaulis biprosthecium C19]